MDDDINEFIQKKTQLSANNKFEILEWISNRFNNIEYFAKSKFGKMYKAIYNYGIINNWKELDHLDNYQWNKSVLLLLKVWMIY